MDVDVRREAIRSRAQAARRRSAEQRGRARELSELAAVLGDGRLLLSESHREGAAQRLELETAMADDGLMPWRAISRYVEHTSQVVGRDPVIEEAKTMLCDRFGIARGDAFAMLRRASSRRNMKLREVARTLVAAGA